ncbi:hypothetical protein AC1031_009617 [Aphanomyces cochlioides]|nr:hypothetical protein AC1031_009617 [Aphanomyces cochlioides]
MPTQLHAHPDTDSTQYTIWVATHIYETVASWWIKFGLRTLLAAYILYQLWVRYYRHCKILLSNLRRFSPEYTRYEVVVCDPAYAILSDLVVSLAMVADIFGGSGYVTLGLIRVTQFQDLWLHANGCLYMSRYVKPLVIRTAENFHEIWFSYLSLHILSSVVKWRRWEATFAPVDPALLAVTAYVYSGPIISVMGITPVMWLFYQMWSLFLPDSQKYQAAEGITSACIMTSIFGALPLIYSRLSMVLQSQKSNRVRSMSSRGAIQRVSNYTYNDMKALILLSMTMQKQAKRSTGATLHQLYKVNPRYKRIPLFSHRGVRNEKSPGMRYSDDVMGASC